MKDAAMQFMADTLQNQELTFDCTNSASKRSWLIHFQNQEHLIKRSWLIQLRTRNTLMNTKR